MTPAEVLLRLDRVGATIKVDGGKLHWEAPVGAVNANLLSAMREHRDTLIDHLSGVARVSLDPRPDLAADSLPWARLLDAARAIDGDDPCGPFGALLGLRCLGAELDGSSGTCRIRPGEIDDAEYRRIRAELLVHRDVLAELLRNLNEVSAEHRAAG